MVSFEQALELIRTHASPLPPTTVPTLQALRLPLAEPIHAPVGWPRFDNSAVDGYAVRASDCPGSLRVVRESKAGPSDTARSLGPGEASRIFTGAEVPPGADAVVMQEDVARSSDWIEIGDAPPLGANIRKASEEFRQGDLLLESGVLISPATIGLLASLGFESVPVRPWPRVAVVTTGDEVRPLGETLLPGEIYESNSAMLAAALHLLGVPVTFQRAVIDQPDLTRSALAEALVSADVVLSTGGVSVGDHDVVRAAFASLGFEEVFWRVAIKPGKPVYFGRSLSEEGPKYALGLPGNPVSAAVGFLLFGKAILRRLLNRPIEGNTFRASWREPTRPSDRTEFVRVQCTETEHGWRAVPLKGQGSHMLLGLAQARGLAKIDPNSQPDEVEVIALDWGTL